MIDEIPERDHKTNPSTSPMSLTRLAILLTLIFAVLLAMLLGSRALDTLAAKLWPAPTSKEAIAQQAALSSSSSAVPIPNSLPSVKFEQQSKESAALEPMARANAANPANPANLANPANPTSSVNTPAHALGSAATTVAPILNSSTVMKASSASNASNASSASLGTTVAQPMPPTLAVTDSNPVLNTLPQKREELQKGEALALQMNPDTKADNKKNTKNDNKTEPLEASLKNANEAIQQEKVNKLEQSQKTPKKQAKMKDAKQYTVAEKEILKNDPRHYTVQILGMHNKAKLKQFMNEAKLQGKVRYCRGAHQGKPWYVLVYGEYSTREEAQKVIAELPAELQKQKPWIRSFASLQGTIHARE